MRILIVSYEAWRETNNGGNVLSNVFEAFPDAQIAQIYCSGELPQNSLCKKYFQISDAMLLTKTKGRGLEEKDYESAGFAGAETAGEQKKKKIPALFYNAMLLARELLWTIFYRESDDLKAFILDFEPDIIFAPCYSYFHVSKLALYVKSMVRCPMISYISDDNYSLKQFQVSPCFWINRMITRKWIRRLFAECSLIYTMTDVQKREYSALFGKPMKVLCKSADFAGRDKETKDPIRLIYAGGLYLNRWKVLARVAESLVEINRGGVLAQLHIFSGSGLKKSQMRKLNDRKNSFLHSAVSYRDLREEYRKSDVALFVESFDLKNRLMTRLSFSTKIIDCLNSGCAVLAIGPACQAGMVYLKENDSAICVNDIADLSLAVRRLIEQPGLISEYAQKAYDTGKKNHDKSAIQKGVRDDFYKIVNLK